LRVSVPVVMHVCAHHDVRGNWLSSEQHCRIRCCIATAITSLLIDVAMFDS
jgi:hypothetical protein